MFLQIRWKTITTKTTQQNGYRPGIWSTKTQYKANINKRTFSDIILRISEWGDGPSSAHCLATPFSEENHIGAIKETLANLKYKPHTLDDK